MSIPVTIQTFDAFLGSQEAIHSIILPDVLSSGGSKNLWIDKYGRAKKILGYVKQNSAAVTTNVGASATLLRELFPYRASTSGSFTRRVFGYFDDGVNEAEIWYSDDLGVTWTFVEDLGAGSINKTPDFAQLGSDMFMANGVVAVRTFDGTTWATSGGTQMNTPSSTASGTGNLTGTYQWRLLPITSAGERKLASAASMVLLLEGEQGALTWTADSDGTVVGYEIYRTTGTGKIFRFVSYVDGRTTVAYTDNITDETVLEERVLEEHGDAPPTGVYFCEPHKQRMWYFRTDAAPQTGWWSDAGDADSVYNENQFPFNDQETMGDVITGARGDFEGHLVVFQERSVWTVSGTGTISGSSFDWVRDKTNAQTGAVSHRSVARVPAGARYVDQLGKVQIAPSVTLAYFTPLGDIRIFDGVSDVIISHPKKTTLSTFNYTHRSKVVCLEDHVRNEITWLFPGGSASEPSIGVTWNYRWGVWYEREWAFSCAREVESSDTAQTLLAGSPSTTTGGYCYKLWSGNNFDGAVFRAQWMTKTLYGTNEQKQPALSHTKRWRWADFLFETDNNVILTIEWIAGNTPDEAAAEGSTTIQPGAFSLLSSDGDTILSADGDTLIVAQSSSQAMALLQDTLGRYLHDEGLRLRIYDNSDDGSWSLEGFTLAYQVLPGLKRRMP
jgi:hypothetical protein